MAAAPSLASLNWDVLCHIVDFLPRRDISSLMKTSRDFYDLCLRPLFLHPVKLRAENILSFHACLRLGSTGSRAHHLRHVAVRCSLSRSPLASRNGPGICIEDLLDEIFQAATSLKRLQLDWGAAISASCLRYRAAPASAPASECGLTCAATTPPPALPCLEELEAPFVSEPLWAAIAQLRAPLRVLKVKFGPMHRFPAADPVALLAPFCTTLKHVDLTVVHCGGAGTDTVYPHVRHLALADTYYGLARGGLELASIVRAFPSVKEFAFSAARVTPEVAHWRDGRATDHIELIERCRDVNERVRSLGCTAWPALERVSVGHVLDLYMLALPSVVPRVEIQAMSEGTLWMLPHVLEDARPVELTLGLFAREHVLECIPHLLAPCESTANLRKFALEIQCDLEFEISIGITLTRLSALLAPLAVEHLSLHLTKCDSVGPYRLPAESVRTIESGLDRIAAVTVEDECATASLFIAVPSLQDVTVAVGTREMHWVRGQLPR